MEATAIGGTLLRNAVSFLTARWSERRHERQAAKRKLRSIVMHVLAQLDAADAYDVIAQRKVEVDAAIGEVQILLAGRARARFAAAAAHYHECREAVQPGFLIFLEYKATGKPIDESPNARFIAALHGLLADG